MILNEIKCPSCGNKIKYDPKTGMNLCEACNNYYYIQGEFDESHKVICPNCGGELKFDVSKANLYCESCESRFEIAKTEEENKEFMNFKPDYVVPFSVQENDVKMALIDAMVAKDYVPDDIFEKTAVDYIRGYYQPYYRFEAYYEANWSASVGYERVEQYEDYERTYNPSTKSYYNKRVIKERKVIDWHPLSGKSSGKMDLWAPATAIENKAYSIEMHKSLNNSSVVQLKEAYDEIVRKSSFPSAERYSEQYLAGFEVTPFTKNVNDAWKDCSELRSQIIGANIENEIPGQHVKDVQWNSNSTLKKQRSYFVPLWVVSYYYNKNHYTYLLNGADIGEEYLSAPKDETSEKIASRYWLPFKIWVSVLIGLFIIAIVGFFGEFELFEFAFNSIPFMLVSGAICGLIGYFGKKSFLTKKKSEREERSKKAKENINEFFARTHEDVDKIGFFEENTTEKDVSIEDNIIEQENDTQNTNVEENKPKSIAKKYNLKKIAMITVPIICVFVALVFILNGVFNSKEELAYNDDAFTESSQSNLSSSHNSSNFSSGINSGDDTTSSSKDSNVSSDNKTQSSSQSSSSSKPSSSQSSSSKPVVNTDPCVDGHSWKELTKTVHHEEVGHYEDKEIANKVNKYKCAICYSKFNSVNEYYSHFDASHGNVGNSSIFRDRYESVEDWEYSYEKQWVVDTKAYDETVVTGYKCSVCGETK